MSAFNLKEFRKANKISQQELAAYVGVGQGFISQMERGERSVPDYVMDKILSNKDWTIVVTEEKKEPVELDVKPDKVVSVLEVYALQKEVSMLRAQIEELKAEKAQYWEMIKSLTAK